MNSLAGIGWKILATLLFAVMIAIIKEVSDTIPTGEIIFTRCTFSIIPLLIVAVMQGSWRDCIVTRHPWLHVRRSFVGAAGMFCWFSAIAMLPLPEATAISFLSPLMVVALAAILLKEQVRLYRWSAVFIGFIGVMIILYPRLSQSEGDIALLGAAFAVLSTVFMAIAAILIRKMTVSEKNTAIVFYFFAATSVLSLGSLYWGWVMPDGQTFLLLVVGGIFGGLGQICMTQAFRVTEASLLAPFDYVNMIWAVVTGILLFNEYPTMPVMIGGTIVIMAGMFVVHRERQLGIKRKAVAPVKT